MVHSLHFASVFFFFLKNKNTFWDQLNRVRNFYLHLLWTLHCFKLFKATFCIIGFGPLFPCFILKISNWKKMYLEAKHVCKNLYRPYLKFGFFVIEIAICIYERKKNKKFQMQIKITVFFFSTPKLFSIIWDSFKLMLFLFKNQFLKSDYYHECTHVKQVGDKISTFFLSTLI